MKANANAEQLDAARGALAKAVAVAGAAAAEQVQVAGKTLTTTRGRW